MRETPDWRIAYGLYFWPRGADIQMLARRYADPPGGVFERPLQATLDALASPAAVLDRTGRIIGASRSWRALAGHEGAGVIGAVGDNYLQVCDRVVDEVSGAAALRKGLMGVLRGSRARFEWMCSLGKDCARCDFRIVVTHLRIARPHWYLVIQEEVTELAEAKEIAREASKCVFEVQAQERQRLADNLHDSVGQSLASMGLDLARLKRILPPTAGVESVMNDLSADLRDAHAQIRTISYLLHPPWEECAGNLERALLSLVHGFAERAGLQTEVRITGPLCEWAPERELALFRILQEALVNIHRHARASTVFVQLDNRGREVTLRIRDDGYGFAAAEAAPSLLGVGLRGMRARVMALQGDLQVVTGPAGTTLEARLPSS
jgi:two-component system NarL family sensor kinase